jgi:hypothetical protein
MRAPRMNERGIALVVAIFALVVIGALVAGTFLVGRLEQRIGASTMHVAQASEAADAGLADALELDESIFTDLDTLAETTLPTEKVTVSGATLDAPLRYTQTIQRLNRSLFLVRSVGERLGKNGTVIGTAERGLLARLERAVIDVNSAITIMQPIKLNGNAFGVDGFNTNPAGWGDSVTGWKPCPPVKADSSDDKIGIRSAAESGMDPKADTANVQGYPVKAVEFDSSITSSTFRDFVDKTFASMTNQPGVKELQQTNPYNGVEPVVNNGTCDKSSALNFGEPLHPSSLYSACYNYFPIVNGTGSQTKFAAGSRGQGTLLIEGDLEINGGFEWTGLIIVRGSFKINGTGNKITGAVLAESITDDNSIGGNVDIQYSSCAIEKAVKAAATVSPLNERSWMQLY